MFLLQYRFQQPELAESILKVNHIGHVLHAFVNGKLIGMLCIGLLLKVKFFFNINHIDILF